MKADIADYINEYELTLKKNDIMVLCTDGLYESINNKNVMFEGFMPEIIKKSHHKTVDEIMNTVLDELNIFCEKKTDDITLIVIKKS